MSCDYQCHQKRAIGNQRTQTSLIRSESVKPSMQFDLFQNCILSVWGVVCSLALSLSLLKLIVKVIMLTCFWGLSWVKLVKQARRWGEVCCHLCIYLPRIYESAQTCLPSAISTSVLLALNNLPRSHWIYPTCTQYGNMIWSPAFDIHLILFLRHGFMKPISQIFPLRTNGKRF